jgi:hypothetical protein
MKIPWKIDIDMKQYIFIVMSVISFLTLSGELIAQENPPRPIEVTATSQGLSFGAFTYATVSGTVTVAPNGSRSASGVVLLNLSTPTAAMFNIVANLGTMITIVIGPNVTLTGPSGGTMTLHIDSTSPASPFPTDKDYPDPTVLYVGGTLTVGNSSTSPPGTYNGTFDLTFSQE